MTMANVNLDGLAKFPYTVRPSSIYVAISVAISSDDLRGGRGGTPFPYYFCSGNLVPLDKTQGWGTSSPLSKTKTGDVVVDHRVKNRQNKPAVAVASSDNN